MPVFHKTTTTQRLDLTAYEAVLCDLDGVITRTAVLHAAAWKQLFDEQLKKLASRTGVSVQAFDAEQDYRLYVDGKSRYDGVRDFLASRRLTLPSGRPDDGPDQDTIYGMGNKKDRYFEAALGNSGVVTYPGTVRFLEIAKAAGLRTAVVSSSHHCREIIEKAGLTPLFDTRIDGHEIDRLHLPGKPAPDAFLEAARRLAVPPGRAIVIEDAQAGVQAGQAGGFGVVIGVDRGNRADVLRRSGADIVVADLAELLTPEMDASSAPSRER
jgi:beta-phosphoglucomutase family hydrolase